MNHVQTYCLANLLHMNVFFCKFRYFSVYTVLGWIILALTLLIPNILNNFLTSNKFLRQGDVSTEQIDKSMHFLIFYLTTVFVNLFVLASCTTIVFACIQHICMMLKITW